MKLVDATTNLATALLMVGVAAYLFGMYDITKIMKSSENENGDDMKPVAVDISERLRIAFSTVVAIVAMSNITGFPQKLVKGQWEETMFGAKFFPWPCCTVRQKRILAGILEMAGLCLTIVCQDDNFAVVRAFGYGVIFVMYGRGTMINSRIALKKALFTLLVASIAAFLLSAEMQNDVLLGGTEVNSGGDNDVRGPTSTE
mmetsp:Transcript_126889/g.189311  ORF Transcript_126889/g.189311 Transcript_126889/m.189311 type:complete len:201 (-) Transcript_126889:147-749(-)|eukprot:CAMPEP_0116998988 /NCGR_PEP_ID=MMETSP0472-20121206/1870_1 /TAXON_ID=693140 ORGANISM="Tiarina fusus, Strain LIS" /NCGR_SAMPLE_ID=MMETSP0472 /ASSEMBLY_ACC=CAM_ASM_000603 /LENGTH=200 /DNA_ID=CAMNT_0004698311 /DNA_START=122 /DNA_END=724 /DNA_ORIENTATION=+